jgi:hypothetical protein
VVSTNIMVFVVYPYAVYLDVDGHLPTGKAPALGETTICCSSVESVGDN